MKKNKNIEIHSSHVKIIFENYNNIILYTNAS